MSIGTSNPRSRSLGLLSLSVLLAMLVIGAWAEQVRAQEADATPAVWVLKIPLAKDGLHPKLKEATGDMDLAAYYLANQGPKRTADVLWLLPDTADVEACVTALEAKDKKSKKTPLALSYLPTQPMPKMEKLSCLLVEKTAKKEKRPACKKYMERIVGFSGVKKPTARAYCELAVALHGSSPSLLSDASVTLQVAELDKAPLAIAKLDKIVKVPYLWNVILRESRKRYKDLKLAAPPAPAVAQAAPAEQPAPSQPEAAPAVDPAAQPPAEAVAVDPTQAPTAPEVPPAAAPTEEPLPDKPKQHKPAPVPSPPRPTMTAEEFSNIWGQSALILAFLGFLLGSFTLLMAMRTRRELIEAKKEIKEQDETLAALQMSIVGLKTPQEPDPHADEIFEKYIGQTDHGLGMPANPKPKRKPEPSSPEAPAAPANSFENALQQASQGGQSESQKIALDVLNRQQHKEDPIVELARKEEAGELRFVPADEPEPEIHEGEIRPLTDLLQSEINKPDGLLGRTEQPRAEEEEQAAAPSSGDTGFETIVPMDDEADTQAIDVEEIQGRPDDTIELSDAEMVEEEPSEGEQDDHAETMELGKPVSGLFEYLTQMKERWPNAPAWWHPFFDELRLLPNGDVPNFAALMNDFTQDGEPVGTRRMKQEWERWVLPYRAYWLIQHFAMPQIKAKAPAQIKLVSGLAVRLADVGRWILNEEQKRGLAHHNLHWFETLPDTEDPQRVVVASDESPLLQIDWVRQMVVKLYATKAPGTLFDVASWGFDSQTEIRPSSIYLLPGK